MKLARQLLVCLFAATLFAGCAKKNYEKGAPMTMDVCDIHQELSKDDSTWKDKRISFEGYFGYSRPSFSLDDNDKAAQDKLGLSEKTYSIGFFKSYNDTEGNSSCLDLLLPYTTTARANSFYIDATVRFSNKDVIYYDNEANALKNSDKVTVSADVKYYCVDNIMKKTTECFNTNPVTKKPAYYYYLSNVRIDKK